MEFGCGVGVGGREMVQGGEVPPGEQAVSALGHAGIVWVSISRVADILRSGAGGGDGRDGC